MKLRLLCRVGTEDSDGKLAGYDYSTIVVDVPDKVLVNRSGYVIKPEIIGGEWLDQPPFCGIDDGDEDD